MGYYIETPRHRNKAAWIEEYLGGRRVALGTHGTSEEIPVVVINNGPFEAAGIAFSQKELKEFTHPSDDRPKVQLLVPKAAVLREQPYVKDSLEW